MLAVERTAEIERLLSEVAAQPERLPQVERELRRRYEQTRAVMIVDIPGAELNLAAKLGEVVAVADEIIATEAAGRALLHPRGGWRESVVSVGGAMLPCYRLQVEDLDRAGTR